MNGDEEKLDLTGEDDWSEGAKEKKPFPENLPPSSDRDFWGDAHRESVTKEELARRQQEVYDRMKLHTVHMQGFEIICTSCPFSHSIPNPDGIFSVANGELVLLDKGK